MTRGCALAVLLLVCSLLPGRGHAEPLTLPDTPGVFARVIVNQSMDGLASPSSDSPSIAQARALRPYYIFERRPGWLRLGRTPREDGLFWLAEEATTPWPHNIVLTFTTRGLPGRTLFLNSLDDISTVLNDELPRAAADGLRARAIAAETAMRQGQASDAGPVVALGPEKGIDSQRNFYYLPILGFEKDMYFDDDFTQAQALKVSILKQRPASAPPPLPSEEYRSGIAFVIDTTRSMGPYLAETKRTVQSILDSIRRGPAVDKFSFALVGFRDSTSAKADVGYTAKTFLPFTDGVDADAFSRAMAEMVESDTSTLHFREDAYAGVMKAATTLDWSSFSARWIVLVTDASARDADDPHSATRRNAQGLANYIRTNLNAGLLTVHLRTPEGANDHARAEAQYRILSMPGNDGPLYLEVTGDSPEARDASYGQIAKYITRLAVKDVARFDRDSIDQKLDVPKSDDAELQQLGEKMGRLAQAFRLDYLGRVQSTMAPDLLTGWALDRDYDERSKRPFDIRLLVTRNELDNLSRAVDDLITLEQESEIDGAGLFDAISGAAAKMARAPDDVATAVEGNDRVGSISGVGSLDALLLSLPYKSESMTIVQRGWDSIQSTEQEKYLNGLYEKQAAYRAHYDDADAWVRLHLEDDDGDMVFPIPLDDLP